MSGYDTTNKLPAKAQNDTYFFLKELEKENAALREENAALKKLTNWRLEARIIALRAENERLRNELYKSNLAIINNVIPPCAGDDPMDIGIIIWHKWPVEKPGKSKWYLVEENDCRNNEGRPFDDCLGMVWWTGSAWHLSGLRPKRWAEIPKPEGEETA
jgi:hypothetical protein